MLSVKHEADKRRIVDENHKIEMAERAEFINQFVTPLKSEVTNNLVDYAKFFG